MNPADIYYSRYKKLGAIRKDVKLLLGAIEYYRNNPADFISDWMDTYDPRLLSHGKAARQPFVLYPRQREMVDFILGCVQNEASGLIEKSRDIGATWTCAALSVWFWLFWPGATIGWGSRKMLLVDSIGDPGSIFEKMRMLIDSLPFDFLPANFNRQRDISFMKIVNPENGSTIVGESGDLIGRGWRTLAYFKDESAHYERPELIEASLGDSTRTPIDISSVSGYGTVFARKRESGIEWEPGQSFRKDRVNVFVFDWRHHPEKDQDWYEERKAKAVAEGMLHLFSQEVDRDYGASVSNILIRREWVRAAIDLHKKIPDLHEGGYAGGLDVADEGGDMNALAVRKGLVLESLNSWALGDTTKTATNAIMLARDSLPIDIMYDSVGVGAGVKGETNRLIERAEMPKGMLFVPWNAGASPYQPERNVIPRDKSSPLNKDHYLNLKAQAWWSLRYRLEKSWQVVHRNADHDPDELISFDSAMLGNELIKLEKELCQVQRTHSGAMKEAIDKRPEGVRSPNLADATVMCYFPIRGPGAYARSFMEAVE